MFPVVQLTTVYSNRSDGKLNITELSFHINLIMTIYNIPTYINKYTHTHTRIHANAQTDTHTRIEVSKYSQQPA